MTPLNLWLCPCSYSPGCCWPLLLPGLTDGLSLPTRTPRAILSELVPAAGPSPYQKRGGSFPGTGAQEHHQALSPPPPQGSPCSPCPWLMTPFQPSLEPSVPAPLLAQIISLHLSTALPGQPSLLGLVLSAG